MPQNKAAKRAPACLLGMRLSTETVSVSWLKEDKRLICNRKILFELHVFHTKLLNRLFSQIKYVKDQYGYSTQQAVQSYLCKKRRRTDEVCR